MERRRSAQAGPLFQDRFFRLTRSPLPPHSIIGAETGYFIYMNNNARITGKNLACGYCGGWAFSLMRSVFTDCRIFLMVLLMTTPLAFATADEPRSTMILVATTTSVQASGLLDVILPPFESARGITIKVVAVGTGAALKLGQNGDADVVIVHAKEAELEYVANGYGVDRTEFMYNEFVIIGPSNDPAGIKGMDDAAKALARIASSKSAFISRGDNSGTHMKELSLWKAAGVKPEGSWYVEIGQGMAECLMMAQEKGAYTLTDTATYFAFKSKPSLPILVRGDIRLRNIYSVIATNPKQILGVNYKGASALIAWIKSPECQKLIADYKKDGQVLFHPLSLPSSE